MLILVINPGATSTKIALFRDQEETARHTIYHDEADLARFERIIDQKDYRKEMILSALARIGCTLDQLDAVSGRGGPFRHMPSGTYRVGPKAVEDVVNPPYGQHVSGLGAVIAGELGEQAGIPAFFSDPVSVDEMEPVARISGYKGMERQSFFHALNHKGMARKAAKMLGKPYEELNLIVSHLGGGVSTAAHKRGKVIDVFDVSSDGGFSLDRGGSLPVSGVVDMCYSGMDKAQVKRELLRRSGMFSYLGTCNFMEIEQKAVAGEGEFPLIFDAFVYQLCKDIGAMAAALSMDVDAVILTGGMANSKKLCRDVEARVGRIAPVLELPGEAEMLSLAQGAIRALKEGAPEY